MFGGNSSLGAWWGTGTGCLERFWMPQPWRFSRPDWMQPWATWSSEWHSCPWQGVGRRWSLKLLPIPSYSIILDSMIQRNSILLFYILNCQSQCFPKCPNFFLNVQPLHRFYFKTSQTMFVKKKKKKSIPPSYRQMLGSASTSGTHYLCLCQSKVYHVLLYTSCALWLG